MPLECAGRARDFPKVVDQVRLLARALSTLRVCRRHGGLRSRKAGFDSRAEDWIHHKDKTSSECEGFARDPAKVVDQVRLLARTCRPSPIAIDSRRWSQTARRPA